jgi:hypothetical protein
MARMLLKRNFVLMESKLRPKILNGVLKTHWKRELLSQPNTLIKNTVEKVLPLSAKFIKHGKL